MIAARYENQQTVSFYSHNNDTPFEDWDYPRHMSQNAIINADHILASSALPLFFPAVAFDGFHYGDGSLGLVAPLRGGIRFRVDQILVVGTREIPVYSDPETLKNSDIPFAHILGNMLNGLFLDNLDSDIEMVNRMNEIARLLSMWKKRRSPWRPINTLYLRPSRDMAIVAQEHYKAMPTFLRYLLNLMGAKNHSGDLLSFLLFEKEFTRELLDLGFKDTIATAKEITDFFA